MKVPEWKNAHIPVEKIEEYLLSKTHPIGKSKALFFNRVGYTLQNKTLLINDIHTIVKESGMHEFERICPGRPLNEAFP